MGDFQKNEDFVYQMEIRLDLLQYPKENDTSEEVSLYLLSF
jgi:hypothetical protein